MVLTFILILLVISGFRNPSFVADGVEPRSSQAASPNVYDKFPGIECSDTESTGDVMITVDDSEEALYENNQLFSLPPIPVKQLEEYINTQKQEKEPFAKEYKVNERKKSMRLA